MPAAKKDIKLGAVCAFIKEQPSHSKYNIKKLVKSLSKIENMQMLSIANGCKVSDGLRDFLNDQPRHLFLELSMNVGVPVAWNLGIDLLECDYLFVLNDDIEIDGHCIDQIVNIFNQYPDTSAAGVEGVICSQLGDNGYPRADVKYKKKKRLFARKEIIEVSAVSGFLFALSRSFIDKTGFRFDTRFTPAFCEEFDLAYFSRANNYKTRIITGLDRHYDHKFHVSSGNVEIQYLDRSIWSQELSDRNIKLFIDKWGNNMQSLLSP